jgi:tRNA pseudouridine38-40 synthase
VEQALMQLMHQPTEVTGAGRTDTGVHASYYVAHFDTPNEISDIPDFVRRINAILPYDIAIFDLRRVKNDAHARFSAISRTYQYHLVNQKNPFKTEFSWYVHYPLDIELMKSAASFLTEIHDFTAFAKLHSNNKTNNCTIYKAEWHKNDHEWIFTISANRFLRNMVRSIVGNLVDVGRKKLSLQEFKQCVLAGDRRLASISAPAKGLFFSLVEYPEDIFFNDSE